MPASGFDDGVPNIQSVPGCRRLPTLCRVDANRRVASRALDRKTRTARYQGAASVTIVAGLPSGEIQQHHIRALLHSFDDNFTTVWRDVEVAHVEFGGEVG